MRFGKYLSYNLIPEWRDYLLNYSILKKALDRIARHNQSSERAGLLQDDEAADLFESLLNSELAKINNFFNGKLKAYLAQYNEYARQDNNAKKVPKEELRIFYREVDGLANYAVLNTMGVKRILQKYDRKLSRDLTAEYMPRLKRMPFVESGVLASLVTDIERLYAELHCEGNLSKAKTKLNPKFYSSSELFSSGVLLGLSIPLLVLLLFVLASSPSTTSLPNFFRIFPVFRAVAAPALFAWLWGLNVLFWLKTKINYLYILEIDPDSHVSYLTVFRLAAVLSVSWLMSFLFYVGAAKGHLRLLSIPVTYYPAMLVFVIVFIMVFPFNLLYRRARFGLFILFFQTLATPFGTLRFRHFLFADILCSMVRPMIDLGYTICWIVLGVWLQEDNDDGYATIKSITNQFIGPIASFLPFWIRLMQCLKKYHETRKPVPHLANAGKYFTSMVAIALATVNSLVYGEDTMSNVKIAWIVLIVVSTIYSYVWDIVFDWGLGNKHSKNFFLRDTLLAQPIGIYYAVIIFDLFGRFFWASTLTPTERGLIQKDFFVFITASVEMARRAFWAFFRVEFETLSNAEQYRTFDFVPQLSAGRSILSEQPSPTDDASVTSEYDSTPLKLRSVSPVISPTINVPVKRRILSPVAQSQRQGGAGVLSEHDIEQGHFSVQ